MQININVSCINIQHCNLLNKLHLMKKKKIEKQRMDEDKIKTSTNQFFR